MKDDAKNGGSSPTRGEPGVGETTVAWAQSLGRNADIVREVELKVRRTRHRRFAAATSALTCLLLVGVVFYRQGGSADSPEANAVTTFVSQPQRQTLPDGSVVELREGARINAVFTADGDGVRRVILASGEAHFSVRENPDRPFVVEAGGVEVRAVGTAFSVAFGRSQVAVLVTAGRVAVERAPAAAVASPTPTPVATVDAGRGVLVELASFEATPLAPVTLAAKDVTERLAWRAPRIRFENTPLAEAVDVFNRHSATRLTLDPALGELRIGGNVRADNTDSFLLLLRTEFGIEPESAADGSVRLRRR